MFTIRVYVFCYITPHVPCQTVTCANTINTRKDTFLDYLCGGLLAITNIRISRRWCRFQTRKSLEVKNAPQKPIVDKRQKL